jgi:hypothetical protein
MRTVVTILPAFARSMRQREARRVVVMMTGQSFRRHCSLGRRLWFEFGAASNERKRYARIFLDGSPYSRTNCARAKSASEILAATDAAVIHAVST